MKSEVFNQDCMEVMANYPDNYFDLAVVDPPYGINHSEIAGKQSGTKYGNAAAAKREYAIKDWDKQIPSVDYFVELIRVSKNQIIWGANYMTPYLPPSMGWVFWDKDNGTNGFSDGELAYTSFERGLRKVKITWNGMLQQDMKNKEERIHPTQKPVALYDWIFEKYAKQHICVHKHGKEYKYLCSDCKDIPNFRVLDTHLGSQSSRIAAYKAGLDFVGCELDPDYFKQGCQRFEDFKIQFNQEVGVEKVLKGQARLF